jgi:hypothetical protein
MKKIFLVIVLLISGCSYDVHMLTPLPVLASNVEVSPTAKASRLWKEVRDPRFGFGLAMPCWWLVNPMPAGGLGGVMTVKNYDEAYFDAHSTKGFWDWPNGALKIDIFITEGVDPAKSDVDAYMALTDSTATGLVSTNVLQTGTHTAAELVLSNLVNRNDPDTRIFLYRIAPDKLLGVAPTPQSIIDTSDFQALLASIVLNPSEPITLPALAPAPALIDAACSQ